MPEPSVSDIRAFHHARNPFPVGGVVEDPATGAAAAAFGAYLRFHRFVTPPARITIFQGADIGRPSRLNVELVAGDERVRVSGTASPIDRTRPRWRRTEVASSRA